MNSGLALFRTGNQTFALSELARGLAGATNSFSLFTGALFGGLFKGPAGLHFTEYAFALQLLLQNAEGLVDIVIADEYLQDFS